MRKKSIRRKRSSARKASAPRLSTRSQATRERALALLSDLRRGVDSYSALLRKHHLDTRTAHKHLGRDLLGGTDGKPVRASKADRRVRELLFPKSYGDVPIRTRSSRDATKLSDYYNDREKLRRGKLSPSDFETKWRGVRVAGEEVFADAPAILAMADDDAFRVETLYASTGGAR